MYKITKNGKPLDPKLYTIDEANKAFISKEDCLVLDFAGEDGWVFRIKYNCTITTGDYCFIDAYGGCIITDGDRCTMDTGSGCNITAGDGCTMDTGYKCHISTGHNAVIRAYADSAITGGENCAVIRNDTNEVIKLVAGQTIRLNSRDVEGYEVIEPIETIEIEVKKYNKEKIEKFLKNLKPIN